MDVPQRTPTNGKEYKNIKNAIYYQQHKDESLEAHKENYQEIKQLYDRYNQKEIQTMLTLSKAKTIINQNMECQFRKSQRNRKGMKEHIKNKKCLSCQQ